MSQTTFVFVHSPLVGPLTWEPAAESLRQRGCPVVVAHVTDQVGSTDPFWKQHAESVRHSLSHLPADQPIMLIAHSGAGPLLPAIRDLILNPIEAYVFVDAGIARDGASRLDLMRSESSTWAEQFEQSLLQGALYPSWTADDLLSILPNAAFRHRLIEELQPRGLPFFTEPLSVSNTWPDAPCIYVQLSETYSFYAEQARAAGWQVISLPAAHFHMLVDPEVFVETLLALARPFDHNAS